MRLYPEFDPTLNSDINIPRTFSQPVKSWTTGGLVEGVGTAANPTLTHSAATANKWFVNKPGANAAVLALVWWRVRGHMMNVSPLVTLLSAAPLDCTTSRGKYLALRCKMPHFVQQTSANSGCSGFFPPVSDYKQQ